MKGGGKTPAPVSVLRTNSAINSVSIDPSGQLIVSADAEGQVALWSRKTQRKQANFCAHPEGILNALFLGRDQKLLTQGREGIVKIWDVETGKETSSLETACMGYGFCRCVISSPDESPKLVTLNDQGQIQEWDLNNSKPIATYTPTFEFEDKTGLCMCLQYISFGATQLIAGSYENGRCYFWQTSSPSPFFSSDRLHTEPALCFDVSERKGKLCGVSGGADTSIPIFDIDIEEECTTVLETINLNHAGVADIKIRPDKKIFATAGWDKRIRVFGWKQVKNLAILKYHTDTINCISFSPVPNDNLLLAGSKDGRVSCWEIF